jgi:hypothetical protein
VPLAGGEAVGKLYFSLKSRSDRLTPIGVAATIVDL